MTLAITVCTAVAVGWLLAFAFLSAAARFDRIHHARRDDEDLTR